MKNKTRQMLQNAFYTLLTVVAGAFQPGDASAMSIGLTGGVIQRTSEPSRAATAGFSLSDQKWNASYGGGLLLGFRNTSRLGFQLGVLYIPFSYSANLTDSILGETTAVSEQHAALRLPLDLQLRISSFVSLVAGGYYDLPLTSSVESDFGVRAGASLHIPIGGKTKLLVQPTYQMGLRKFDGASNSDWSILAGFRFGE